MQFERRQYLGETSQAHVLDGNGGHVGNAPEVVFVVAEGFPGALDVVQAGGEASCDGAAGFAESAFGVGSHEFVSPASEGFVAFLDELSGGLHEGVVQGLVAAAPDVLGDFAGGYFERRVASGKGGECFGAGEAVHGDDFGHPQQGGQRADAGHSFQQGHELFSGDDFARAEHEFGVVCVSGGLPGEFGHALSLGVVLGDVLQERAANLFRQRLRAHAGRIGQFSRGEVFEDGPSEAPHDLAQRAERMAKTQDDVVQPVGQLGRSALGIASVAQQDAQHLDGVVGHEAGRPQSRDGVIGQHTGVQHVRLAFRGPRQHRVDDARFSAEGAHYREVIRGC